MTLQKFSPETKHNTPLSYFGFLLRQNWPAVVTNTIILLLINAVILSMALTSAMDGVQPKHLEDRIIEVATIMRLVNVVGASLLSVLWGGAAMNYVNSKISVNFYHSIPLHRSTLYLSEIFVKLICFALPALVTHVLAICISGVTSGVWGWEATSLYFSSFGYSLLYFFFFFSIMIFCASFTGNAFSRLMSAGLVVAMPAALIACLVSILDFEAVYSRYDHYLQLALEILTPARIVMYFAEVEELSTTAGREIFGTLLATLAFFVAGYLIYRKRKSEMSGLPVLSKIASGIIKYTCMFCAAAVFGLIFHVFVDSYIWYGVGAVIGALLAMMLINVILTKSSKQLFSGLKGMGIFSAAFIALFVFFGIDLVGYDRYIPSAALTGEMSIEVGGEFVLHVEDKEDEAFFLDFLRDYMKNEQITGVEQASGSSYNYEELFADYEKEGLSEAEQQAYREYLRDIYVNLYHNRREIFIEVTIRPHIGFSTVKRFYADPEIFAKFLERIADSDNFVEAYFPDITLENIGDSVNAVEHLGLEATDYTTGEILNILENMKASYNGFEYFQRSTINSVHCGVKYDDHRYSYYRSPYYDDDPQYFDAFCDIVTSVFVLDHKTQEMTEYTDSEEIRAICENLNMNLVSSPFTLTEARYSVAVMYTEWVGYGYGLYYEGSFLRGRIPAFIQ